MPAAVAARLQRAFGLEGRPDTLGAWAEAMADRLDASDHQFGVDDLCLATDGDVRVRYDGRERYVRCVMDAFVIPFVVDGVDRVDVTATTPVEAASLRFGVDRQGIDLETSTAMLSIGTTAAVVPAEASTGLGVSYAAFCPYINPFVDGAEYERWTATTPEARTMAVPLALGVDLARTLLGVDSTGPQGGPDHG